MSDLGKFLMLLSTHIGISGIALLFAGVETGVYLALLSSFVGIFVILEYAIEQWKQHREAQKQQKQ